MIRKTMIVLGSLALIALLWQVITFPRIGKLAHENPTTTAFMEQRRKALRAEGKNDDLSHTWVPYAQISPHLRSAVIVSEDSRFFEHEGVDTTELEKIIRESWEKKELGRGGSTITQQLAKNLYLSPSRNPLRKIKEILIAKRMEQVLKKKRILELYLNLVEFGERVYGAEAAARHYFGKPASALSPGEAALLAGALPNPRRMNPGSPGPYLRSRRDIIVSRMRRWGYMAEQTISSAPAEPKNDPEAPEGSTEQEPAAPEPAPSTETIESPPPDESTPLPPEEETTPVDESEPSDAPDREPPDPPAGFDANP